MIMAAGLRWRVRRLMTGYVVQAGIEYEAFMEALDQQVLYEELRKRV